MYDINYKTISKKDQLRMIRNVYTEVLKAKNDPINRTCQSYCKGRVWIVKEILDDVYNWDADNDCSF